MEWFAHELRMVHNSQTCDWVHMEIDKWGGTMNMHKACSERQGIEKLPLTIVPIKNYSLHFKFRDIIATSLNLFCI